MTDDVRSPPSALKGRLADVFVPALVAGTLEPLSRRLGNRATVDDPMYGRASTVTAIDALLGNLAAFLRAGEATYVPVCSTTGIDRDTAEGRVQMTLEGEPREVPIAVVAERRRLREIEVRVYYAPPGGRDDLADRKHRPSMATGTPLPLVDLVASTLAALRKGAVQQALAAFEETSRVVDPSGRAHDKADGGMSSFFADLGAHDATCGGGADDGRTACIEAELKRAGRPACPAVLSFQRGDSGLMRELRVYWD